MKFNTLVVRGPNRPDKETGAIVPPIYQTATYVLEEVGSTKGYDYTRSSNPSRSRLEEHLLLVENSKFASCFSSGMAAVDAVARMFKPGDHIICSDDVYGGVSRLFNTIVSNYGVQFSYVNSSEIINIREAIKSNTVMIWIETPTNPLLKITDMEALGKLGKEKGILTLVDSTFATPALLKPLDFGVDIVLHSTSKYLSGHNQVIGGVVLTNKKDIYERMIYFQKSIGAIPSPFDCWITEMGLKTLHLRMARHCENALEVAKFLSQHEIIKQVTYPGLTNHPQHAIAKRQMKDYGGMITFELHGGLDSGRLLMNNLELCSLAESLGSVDTMITHPASMTHAEVPRSERLARGLVDGLVRLSVGVEDVEDIIADLTSALKVVKNQS